MLLTTNIEVVEYGHCDHICSSRYNTNTDVLISTGQLKVVIKIHFYVLLLT